MRTSQKFLIPEKQLLNDAIYTLWAPRSEDSNDAERR